MTPITCESVLAFIEAAGKSWGVLISADLTGEVQFTGTGSTPAADAMASEFLFEIGAMVEAGRSRCLAPSGEPARVITDTNNIVALREAMIQVATLRTLLSFLRHALADHGLLTSEQREQVASAIEDSNRLIESQAR